MHKFQKDRQNGRKQTQGFLIIVEYQNKICIHCDRILN